MPKLEKTTREAPQRRNVGINAPREGVTQSLAAPGIQPQVPAPPVRSKRAEALQRLLHGVAGITGTIADIAEGKRRESEKEKRLEITAFNSEAFKMAAGLDYATFPHVEGNNDLEDIHAWADGVTPDWPDESRDYLVNKVFPGLVKFRRDKIRDQQQTGYIEMAEGLVGRLAEDDVSGAEARKLLKGDLAELEKAVTGFGWSSDEFRRRVLQPAARAIGESATSTEDVERAEWFAKILKAHGRPDLAAAMVNEARVNRSKHIYQVIAEQITNVEGPEQIEAIEQRIATFSDADVLFEGQREKLDIKVATKRKEFHHAAQKAVEDRVYGYLMDRPAGNPDRAKIVSLIRRSVRDGIFSPKEAVSLIKTVGEKVKGQEQRRRVLAKVRGKLAGPLVKDDEAAMTDLLDELYDPSDRRGRARFIASAEMVPRSVSERISRGMESADPEITKGAILDYLSLHREYAQGAERVFDKLEDRGQARMMAVMLAADEGKVDLADPATLEMFADEQAQAVMGIEPVEMSSQDALNELLLSWDEGAKTDLQGNVTKSSAQNLVRNQLQPHLAEQWGGADYDSIQLPATETVNRYLQYARDAYRSLLACGRPGRLAAERARRIATAKIRTEMRPVKFDERIVDLGGGPATYRGLGGNLFSDLKDALYNNGWTDPHNSAKKYVPTWSDAHRGYVFVADYEPDWGRILTFWNEGQQYPFVVSPDTTSVEDLPRAVVTLELGSAAADVTSPQGPPDLSRREAQRILDAAGGDPDIAEGAWRESGGDIEQALELAAKRKQ